MTTRHHAATRGSVAQGPTDRRFGSVFAVLFAFAAGYLYWRHDAARAAAALGVLAMLFLGLAWAAPAALRPLNRGWMAFGHLLGRIVSPIVLGAIYFLVLTPVATLMRAAGRDELRLRRRVDVESHWVDREPPGPDRESFRNQY